MAREYGDRLYYMDVPNDMIGDLDSSGIVVAKSEALKSRMRLLEPGYYDLGPNQATRSKVFGAMEYDAHARAADIFRDSQKSSGGAPSRDYPGRAAASRLNALPLDAVWETFKKSLGNSKQWREYVDFLGETTKDFFKRLTANPKAALKSLADASKTSSGENAAASAIRLLNEDLGRRARIIVDKFDSPTARKVLDMMDFEMGRGEGVGTVFREAMQRRLNVGLNGLKPVLEAVAAAEDSLRAGGMGRKDAHAKVWEAVIERVENPGMSRSGHIGAAAKAVEGWYKELLDMQREAGVDIGDRGPAYFTVRYDADKIAANPDAFTRDITEAYKAEGVAADEARARAEALTTAKLRGESVELVGMLSGSASSVTKERQFTKPAVLNSLRKWRVMDGEELMQAYAYGAAQRASIAERFGDNFGGTREEVVRGGKRVREGKVIVKSWKQLTDDITREGGAGALPILRQIVEIGTGINSPRGGGAEYADFFRNAMTMGALEKSVLPNLMEAVTPLATTNGNMAAALNLMRSNLQAVLHGVGILPKSERRAAAQALLEGLGSISDIGARAQAMARYSGMDSGKGVMSKATGKFFEGIGLTRLEDTNRITAADVGGVWFDSMAKSILGDKGWQSLTKGTDARTLRDFGIPAGKERAFAEYVRSLDGGIPTVADLHAAGEMGKLYSTAINRFVHSTVQHSDGLTRPSWASTPWGALVYQFSSYTYTFHKNVIRRAYNNAMAAGNLKNDMGAVDRLALATGMLPGLMVMGAASYASMWARDELLNELAGTKKNLTQQAKNERAVMNANLFGKYGRIFEQFGQQRWGTGSAGLFVPPAVAQAAKAADQVVAGVRDNSPSNTAERKAVKAVFNTVVEPAWQIALSAGPGLPFGVASVGLRTFAPSAAEGVVTDAVAGPMKSRRETVVKGVFE